MALKSKFDVAQQASSRKILFYSKVSQTISPTRRDGQHFSVNYEMTLNLSFFMERYKKNTCIVCPLFIHSRCACIIISGIYFEVRVNQRCLGQVDVFSLPNVRSEHTPLEKLIFFLARWKKFLLVSYFFFFWRDQLMKTAFPRRVYYIAQSLHRTFIIIYTLAKL